CPVPWMDAPKTSGERAGFTHRVHHTRRRVGASKTDTNGAIDDSEDNEPPSCAPQSMAKNVVRVRIGGEGSHALRSPADRARVGHENVEDTDSSQRERDGLADELCGTAGFLGERCRRLEAAQGENRENHPCQDTAEVVG